MHWTGSSNLHREVWSVLIWRGRVPLCIIWNVLIGFLCVLIGFLCTLFGVFLLWRGRGSFEVLGGEEVPL